VEARSANPARPFRRAAIVALLATVAGLAACGGSRPVPTASRPTPRIATPRYAPTTPLAQPDPNIYPAVVRQQFLHACEHGGTSPAICTCTFARLRGRYTARRFVELFRTSRGREPPAVQEAVRGCERS
jgi:hypothetical protein